MIVIQLVHTVPFLLVLVEGWVLHQLCANLLLLRQEARTSQNRDGSLGVWMRREIIMMEETTSLLKFGLNHLCRGRLCHDL